MAESIDVHPASDEERRRAYELAYETWGTGSRAAWIQKRLESQQHNRADWWVGTQGSDVVTSLGVYPLLLRLAGDLVTGCGIGAVHTDPEFRGRGFATELCETVMEHARGEGDAVALLYTDIDPEFYRALGFETTNRFDWTCDDLRGLADAVDRTTHAYPLDPAVDGERLRNLYDRAHATSSLCMVRDSDYWRYLDQLHPDDEVVVVESGIGEDLLYARLREGDRADTVIATELPYLTGDPADCAAGLAGLAGLLVGTEVHQIRVGAEPRGEASRYFNRTRRDDGIPMVAPLGGDFKFDVGEDARFWRTDKF